MLEKRRSIKRRENETFTYSIENKAIQGLKHETHGATNQQVDLMSKQTIE